MTADTVKLAAGAAAAVGVVLVGVGVLMPSARGSKGALEDAQPRTTLVVTAAELAAHREARPILLEAARRTLKREPTPRELQYLHGVAFRETHYGKGWSGAMASANNWGAVSCNPATFQGGGCVPGQTDHTSNNVAYTTGFRSYPTPVDGAADVVQHVLVQRPRTAAALASSPSAFRASYAMRHERYYGGFCPVAVKQHGEAAGDLDAFAHPDRDEGSRACEAEAVAAHARAMFDTARAVAQALNEPLALKLGTLEDARAWYAGGAA